MFTGRVRSAFAAAEAEGISFPSVARGYVLLRFAKVAPDRKAVILAAARQSYEEKDIAAALRTTYPEGLGASRREHVHAVEATALDQAVLAAERSQAGGILAGTVRKGQRAEVVVLMGEMDTAR